VYEIESLSNEETLILKNYVESLTKKVNETDEINKINWLEISE
jgi:hypothetical protein